jgi:hypothetical protein
VGSDSMFIGSGGVGAGRHEVDIGQLSQMTTQCLAGRELCPMPSP